MKQIIKQLRKHSSIRKYTLFFNKHIIYITINVYSKNFHGLAAKMFLSSSLL